MTNHRRGAGWHWRKSSMTARSLPNILMRFVSWLSLRIWKLFLLFKFYKLKLSILIITSLVYLTSLHGGGQYQPVILSSLYPGVIIYNPILKLCITFKPRYNEPWYSEFHDIVNQTQLPFWGFTNYITFDIVKYSI